MNDVNFCYKLHDAIAKLYSDTSAYRITTYEDEPYKVKIDYIPARFNELIDNVKTLSSISSYVEFNLNNPTYTLTAKITTKKTGESLLVLNVCSNSRIVCYNLQNDTWHFREKGNAKKYYFFQKTTYILRAIQATDIIQQVLKILSLSQ